MKAKIQRSMLLVLFVTILIFYGLLTLVMYQKNLTLLKEEVNQEAVAVREVLYQAVPYVGMAKVVDYIALTNDFFQIGRASCRERV